MTTKKEELADPHGKGFMGDKEEREKYKADSTAKGVEAWKEGAESTDPCSGGFTGMLPTGFYDLSGNVDWCQAPMPGWQPSWVDIDYMEKLGVGWFLKKWDLYPKCDKDPESFPPKERWKSWDGTLSKYGRALQCYEEYQKRGWDTKAKSKPWLTAPGAKSPAGLGSGVPRGPASGLGGAVPHVLGGDGAAGPMGAHGEAGGSGAGGAGSAENPCCCCPKPETVTYSGARTNDSQEGRQFLSRPGGPVGQTLSGQSQGSYATASFMQSAVQVATQALARAAQAARQASEGSTAETTSTGCPSQEGTCTCCECCGVPEELPSDSAHPGTTTLPKESDDRPGTHATGEPEAPGRTDRFYEGQPDGDGEKTKKDPCEDQAAQPEWWKRRQAELREIKAGLEKEAMKGVEEIEDPITRNRTITLRYVKLAKTNTDYAPYAALAARASQTVGSIMNLLKGHSKPGSDMRAMMDNFAKGNLEVYREMYWSNKLLIDNPSLLEEMIKFCLLSPSLAKGFAKAIRGAKLTLGNAEEAAKGRELIWNSLEDIVEREQTNPVQLNVFNKGPDLARILGTAFGGLAGASDLGAEGFAEYFRNHPDRQAKPDGPDFASPRDRFEWIRGAILPRYKEMTERGEYDELLDAVEREELQKLTGGK